MAKKNVKSLSSEELFRLAEQKKAQEDEKAKAKVKEQLAELRAEKREIVSRHKKELADIEKRINSLTKSTSGKKSRKTGTSSAIVQMLKKGEMSTKDIRKKLTSQGISVENMGQTLAYLKRNKRIKSTGRGMYKKA